MSVTVSISGDFCITPSYLAANLFSNNVSELFQQSHLNIVNLECPVNKDGEQHKILKYGPHLQTNEDIFKHLKQLKIGAVTLANNHILDYGVQGLQATIDACRKNGIVFTGVGSNLVEAGVPKIIEQNGLKIALVNFCENEWSIATGDTAGANPLDVIDNLRQIQSARVAADFVLVIIHGGHEFYNLPSPRMVKQYRFFAEHGADAVIAHHTHCISGMELHKGIPIFYGLGNMIFTKASEYPGWYNGLIVQFNLQKGRPVQWQLIPLKQEKETYQLQLLEGTEKENLLQEVRNYSAVITTEEKLQSEWNAFVNKRKAQYLYVFSAMNVIPGRYLKGLLKRLGFIKILFPQKYITGIVNYINCEAHLDVSKAALNKQLKK